MSRQAKPLCWTLVFLLTACAGIAQDLPTDLPSPTVLLPPPTSEPSDTPEATVAPTSPPGEPVALTAIQMLTPLEGWGIADPDGGPSRVLKTIDGGVSWTDRSSKQIDSGDLTTWKVSAQTFLNSDLAWVIYSSEDPTAPVPTEPVVWFTTDGGIDWNASSPLPPPDLADFFIPGELQFTDSQHGWLLVHLGAGMSHDYISIYATGDGGKAWEIVADPTTAPEIQGCQKTGMSFSGHGPAWLTADCMGVVDGAIFYLSDDSGSTWRQTSLAPPDSYPDLFTGAYCSTEAPSFFDAERGQLLLRCRSGSSGEVETSFLYRTQDAGATWQSAPFPGGELLTIDDQVSWAAGESLYLTQDAGQVWQFTGNPPWVSGIDFVDQDNGWLLGQPGDELQIDRTEDGGRSWTLVEPQILPD